MDEGPGPLAHSYLYQVPSRGMSMDWNSMHLWKAGKP